MSSWRHRTDTATGFCVTRVLATSLRIAWACHPDSIRLGLASTIFFYAGVILLFIANMFFVQRIVRAQHPHVGWSAPFTVGLPLCIAIIVGTIFTLIAAIILEFYSLSESIRHSVRIIQIYGATVYAIMAFLPIPIVIASALARLHPSMRHLDNTDKFGQGSMRAKVIIVLVSGILLALGASFRAGTTWLTPVPILTDTVPPEPYPTPWYFSKAAFYPFDFAIEAFIVWFWIAVRIDRRFIVPDGAKGPYSYAGGYVFAGEPGNEKKSIAKTDSLRQLTGSQASGLGGGGYSAVSLNGSSRASRSHHRVSWGGISRDDVHAALGEDGIEVVPYAHGFDDADGDVGLRSDMDFGGAEQEMGWDPKSGKWALRPVTTMGSLRDAYSEHEQSG